MTGTTIERPLLVKAERVRLSETLRDAHNELEELTFRIDEGLDPADETREVGAEHIAELSVAISDLDLHLGELGPMRERLEEQRRYLVHAYAEQHAEVSDDAG